MNLQNKMNQSREFERAEKLEYGVFMRRPNQHRTNLVEYPHEAVSHRYITGLRKSQQDKVD
jgi:hypothetical protein